VLAGEGCSFGSSRGLVFRRYQVASVSKLGSRTVDRKTLGGRRLGSGTTRVSGKNKKLRGWTGAVSERAG